LETFCSFDTECQPAIRSPHGGQAHTSEKDLPDSSGC